MKQTLIIQTGHTNEYILKKGPDFSDMFQAVVGNRHIKICNVFEGEVPPNAFSAVDRVIVTGSLSMATERMPWMLQTEAWLRNAAAAGVPILGICFGHQMLAMAFGGSVGDHPMGTEMGTSVVALNEAGVNDPLFAGIPKRFAGYVAHTQSVLAYPETAVCLGSSDYEPNHIIKWGANIYGFQFHPEFTDEVIKNGIARLEDKRCVKRIQADALSEADGNLRTGRELLKRFMQLSR
ncbi:glutamine amidotransferase [Fusibacter paucivorans]|uniref:Glutamine amidotransferase n=1 Tax=Fusibacter paucivorans TaxID=76009 RepID=A0ABS5PNK9_9FIRM|nr:glutamine amidotransferase [Fusibacter paucivorans]MBS7525936.1 glutamine amidotransferase [Fusibacter paucivorans]